MQLAFGFTFNDLLYLEGLKALDRCFLDLLKIEDIDLYKQLLFFRTHHSKSYPCHSDDNLYPQDNTDYEKQYSELLIELALFTDNFLAQLFFIEDEVNQSRQQHVEFNVIYQCKRKFVQRIAVKKYPKDQINNIDFVHVKELLEQAVGEVVTPKLFALKVMEWQKQAEINTEILDIAAQYASYIVHNGSNHVLFNLPKNILPNQLLDQAKIEQYKNYVRTGFDYCDNEFTSDNVLNNAHYCIYCHNQSKDSCSKGLPQQKNGCPLRQKISEMNYIKSCGFNLAALAVIVIDNPIVAATGYRICNDCVQSCIYQKQDPVDIPIIESDILRTVLNFPYGLEIYLLLTRWNPLNIHSYLPQKATGYNVMIVGLGPAGFSLAHYMLNDGHNVVAIDGLKIAPLSFDLMTPIKNWSEYKQKLSERLPQGFGGVTEYGITARWDKNNLAIIRLILERRSNFKLYGSVRFGSNINTEQIFQLGFDHIALCVGAGHPKILPITNILAKGVKVAADFLLTLQSQGAYLQESITNLLIRMPIAVIGGGLTGIDAAVEALYYYPMQVQKFWTKYKKLVNKYGEEYVEQEWTAEDRCIAEEFITHAKLFAQAKSQEELRNILRSLGGVTLYYRKNLVESPSYKSNHQEILHAIAAGVNFREHLQPVQLNLDTYDYLQSIEFVQTLSSHPEFISGSKKEELKQVQHDNRSVTRFNITAKTMLIAVGVGDYLDQKILIKSDKISYFGDCNPDVAGGSVVNALSDSKYRYSTITNSMLNDKPKLNDDFNIFIARLDQVLSSEIIAVNHLSTEVIELIVHSPYAAKNYQAGQFFRLQNYTDDLTKQCEPIAVTATYVDLEQNHISLIIANRGYSSSLCKSLQVGEQLSLMGPIGVTTTEMLKQVQHNGDRSRIVLIGYGVSNIMLLHTVHTLSNNGCYVTYIAGYDKIEERIYPERMEQIADEVIWCYGQGLLDNFKQYCITNGRTIDHIICIAPAKIMQAIYDIKNEILGKECKLICHINAPMQCMMSGICGQCIQTVKDSGEYIFTCMCKEQDANIVDFDMLNARLQQNSLFEKILRCDSK